MEEFQPQAPALWQQPPQPKLYDYAISLIDNSLAQLNNPEAQRLYSVMNPNQNLNLLLTSLRAASDALKTNNRTV